MDYVTLGKTGLEVSEIGLGCYSFGSAEPWMLGDEASIELIQEAIDLGVNLFDTANVYSFGESEEILGTAAKGHRDNLVISTKAFFQMDSDNRASGGLSRKALDQELEASLGRLDMETIDLFQIHRWDRQTPIEQTLRALDDAVHRGAVRYVGASSMWAYQLAESLHTSERQNLVAFSTMENHYNLVYREDERELLPYCAERDIGVIPWSPLARGFLTRPVEELDKSPRSESDQYYRERMEVYRKNGGIEINKRVEELAGSMGLSMAQVALAWLLHKDWVDAPIIGTTSVDHLRAAVEAIDVSLSDSDIDYLEAPYEPVEVLGHGDGWEKDRVQ